jgi:hypothetical protein
MALLSNVYVQNTFAEWVSNYNLTATKINDITQGQDNYLHVAGAHVNTFTTNTSSSNNLTIAVSASFDGNTDFVATSNVIIQQANNLHIMGGTSGYYLQTNGSGLLEWAAGSAVNDFSDLTGTIANNQFDHSHSIAANTTWTGANTVFESANINFGSVASLHIDGGTAGYALTTDGAGTLSWAESSAGGASLDHDEFTGTGACTEFTVTTSPPNTSSLMVWVGGAIQTPVTNYSVNGNTVTFTSAPSNLSQIYTISLSSADVTVTAADDTIGTSKLQTGSVTFEKIAVNAKLWKSHRWTANGTANSFTVTTSPANSDGVFVMVGGVVRDSELNSTASGNTITLNASPANGVPVVIRSTGFTSNVAVVADQSVTTAKLSASAVSTVKIADSAVSTVKIANNAVSTIKIANDAVTFAKTDTTWNTATSNTTMVAGGRYFVSTTGGAVTMTLPVTPTQGDWVRIIDTQGTADTNNITVARDANSISIQGSNTDMTVSTERAAFSLVYFNTTQGWLLTEV